MNGLDDDPVIGVRRMICFFRGVISLERDALGALAHFKDAVESNRRPVVWYRYRDDCLRTNHAPVSDSNVAENGAPCAMEHMVGEVVSWEGGHSGVG